MKAILDQLLGPVLKMVDMDLDSFMREVLSPLLGMVITFAAIFLQAPQIYACYTAKSCKGLAPASLYASSLSPLSFTIYSIRKGNAIHSWLENLILMVQNIVLVIMLWNYASPSIPRNTIYSICACFPLLVAMCFSIPDEYEYILPLMNIPFLMASRLPQLVANYRQGGTGTLSPIPLFLVAVGALVRIFTTVQTVGMDWSVISTYLCSSSLASLTLLQYIYYNYLGGGNSSTAPIANRTRSSAKKTN
jgi:mannose-P-dolichol utilization defect protein 1